MYFLLFPFRKTTYYIYPGIIQFSNELNILISCCPNIIPLDKNGFFLSETSDFFWFWFLNQKQ